MSSPIRFVVSPCAAPISFPISSIPSLPLDNRRSPGYRRVEPAMAGNRFYLWIGQHETGRYSKAHKHASAAVLICVKGKGYTYTWPESLGTTPWKDGKADKILRQDYEAGRHGLGRTDERGLVPSAFRHRPGGDYGSPPGTDRTISAPASPVARASNSWISVPSISARAAAPFRTTRRIRRSATSSWQALEREGVASRMNPEFYQRPPGEGEEVMGDVM